ncbi:MAG: LysM peptidoglycan-binding domain-containing protein [Deltaproteobacteria bacterium]|nr:LysM peptidoglycan-binding domain-containing protein [Deltaproteobacteria bacterium]
MRIVLKANPSTKRILPSLLMLTAVLLSLLLLTGSASALSGIEDPQYPAYVTNSKEPETELYFLRPWQLLCESNDAISYPKVFPACKKTVTSNAPILNMPSVTNKDVEWFLDYFQGRGRTTFKRWLERSNKYTPMIREILKAEGLPEDLIYLAMIESGFSPTARSNRKAVGVWQFIPWTGKRYGLRIDWWIDERQDTEKATHAAAEYLRDLYERFDSWYLAMAGYNAGEGRIARGLRKHNVDNFWDLASHKRTLKRETRNYVPKFLAAMIIAKDPKKYGFTEIDYNAPISYRRVNIPQPTDIKVIAKAAGTTISELKSLNPELKRWFTPPNDTNYTIKIPTESVDIFKENMALIPTPERVNFLRHKVKRGESLWEISRRYRTSIKPILYLNNLRSARFIREGSTLVIPIRSKTKSERAVVKVASMPSSGTYTVRSGDTLWDISRRFGINIKKIIELNQLPKSGIIRPGQRLDLSLNEVPREDVSIN